MEQVTSAHYTEYDSLPEIVVSAPGRFHLLGEHSWFFKDKTLSMAVTLPVYIAISQRPDTAVKFFFSQLKERKRSNLTVLKYRREDRWANALKSIISGFLSAGTSIPGLNITVSSDIVPSAGMGVTSAIKVATAVALRALFAPGMGEPEFLQCIDRGNQMYFSSLSHCADIFTALYSRENSCILTDHANSSFEHLSFDFKDMTILLTDAHVPRVCLWDEESLRTAESASWLKSLKIRKNGILQYTDSDAEIAEILSATNEETRRRLLCIIKESQCVTEAIDALKNSVFSSFARSVSRSHELLRDLYCITCPEIDWLIKRVQEIDVNNGKELTACSRITGKGFGRCTYTILRTADVAVYTQKFADYERIFGFHPTWYLVKPSEGAKILL